MIDGAMKLYLGIDSCSRPGKLRLRRVAIVTVGFHQLGVRAALGDAALVEHDHAVALTERAQAMSDYEVRTTLHRLVHRRQDFMLGVWVDGGSRIVEQQNGGVE